MSEVVICSACGKPWAPSHYCPQNSYAQPSAGGSNPVVTTVQLPAFNAFQCSAVWGYGHRCSFQHGHARYPCECACGEKQAPLSQCPNSPGQFVGGQYVIQFPAGGSW